MISHKGSLDEHFNIFVWIVVALIGILIVASFTGVAFTPFTGGPDEHKGPVNTTFPVHAWSLSSDAVPPQWTDCNQQDGGWQRADEFCKCQGYRGAAPAETKPCYHEWNEQRYTWVTSSCPVQRDTSTGKGAALMLVNCTD